jgi:hypothetical protein
MTDLGAALQHGGWALWGLMALLFAVGMLVGAMLSCSWFSDEAPCDAP